MIKSSDSTRVVLGNGANQSLRRSGQKSRVPTTARKLKFRKYVSVEALPNQLEMRVLYASDILPKEEDAYYPYKTTHPVAIDLNSLTEEEDQTVVRQGEPFDIRIEGIFTENFDKNIPIARRRNEIVMYSLEGGDEHPSHQERQDEGIPTIHYNHKSDTAVKPDSYFSVPDSKSLVTYYTGSGTPVKRVRLAPAVSELCSRPGKKQFSMNLRIRHLTLSYLLLCIPCLRCAVIATKY
jgi:hypothetical protein